MMQRTHSHFQMSLEAIVLLLSLLGRKKDLFPFGESIFSGVDYCLLGRTEGTNPLM